MIPTRFWSKLYKQFTCSSAWTALNSTSWCVVSAVSSNITREWDSLLLMGYTQLITVISRKINTISAILINKLMSRWERGTPVLIARQLVGVKWMHWLIWAFVKVMTFWIQTRVWTIQQLRHPLFQIKSSLLTSRGRRRVLLRVRIPKISTLNSLIELWHFCMSFRDRINLLWLSAKRVLFLNVLLNYKKRSCKQVYLRSKHPKLWFHRTKFQTRAIHHPWDQVKTTKILP